MNIAPLIEDLIFCREAYDNPQQGLQSKNFQRDRLERARERLHVALSAQIRESLRDLSETVRDCCK
jgi:hypothetical protein